MRGKPKKALGQNFLIDRNIQRKMVAACGLQGGDTVLEIGPGQGQITELLAKAARRVYAVELDPSLYKLLKEKFADTANVKLVRGDILKFDLSACVPKAGIRIKVFGNIPYYITTPIIERLIEYRSDIESAFLTVQKEFAWRMGACPGGKDYSAFSCFIQYYALVRNFFKIKNTCFYPVPKVDSYFIGIDFLRSPAVRVNDEKLLFKIIRGAFSQRRKTLRNSLSELVPEDKLEDFFLRYGLSRNIRPECLSLQDFCSLANSF